MPLIIGTNKNEGLLIKVNHNPKNFIFVNICLQFYNYLLILFMFSYSILKAKSAKFHKTMNLNVEFHESILQGFFQRDGGNRSAEYLLL